MDKAKQDCKIDLRIDEALLKRLDAKCVKYGLTRSAALKRMVKDFVAPDLEPIEASQA